MPIAVIDAFEMIDVDQGHGERKTEALHRQVLETRRRLLGTDNNATLLSMNNLAKLLEERGELTESTRANLVLHIDGVRFTPRRDSGLLAGTYRDQLIEEGKLVERALIFEDLKRAARISLINSVRGWMRAEMDLHTLPAANRSPLPNEYRWTDRSVR